MPYNRLELISTRVENLDLTRRAQYKSLMILTI